VGAFAQLAAALTKDLLDDLVKTTTEKAQGVPRNEKYQAFLDATQAIAVNLIRALVSEMAAQQSVASAA